MQALGQLEPQLFIVKIGARSIIFLLDLFCDCYMFSCIRLAFLYEVNRPEGALSAAGSTPSWAFACPARIQHRNAKENPN